MDEEVVKLGVDKNERFDRRTFEPHIKDLLDSKEIEEDIEDKWLKEEDKEAEAQDAKSYKWIYAAVALLVCAGVGAYLLNQNKVDVSEESSLVIPAEPKYLTDDLEVKETQDALDRSIRSFLTAESVADKLKTVRHQERVKPLMEDYYTRFSLQQQEVDDVTLFHAVNLEGKSFTLVEARLIDGAAKSFLTEMVNGEYKVDWESYVKYNPISWDRYIQQRSTEAYDMRVYVKLGGYYIGEYRDDEIYQCYEISAFDNDDVLFGYVKRDSDAGRAMENHMKLLRGRAINQKQAMLLRLRFPESAVKNNLVMIEAMHMQGWTYAESP